MLALIGITHVPTDARFAAEWFRQTTGRSGLLAHDVMYGMVEGVQEGEEGQKHCLIDVAKRADWHCTICQRSRRPTEKEEEKQEEPEEQEDSDAIKLSRRPIYGTGMVWPNINESQDKETSYWNLQIARYVLQD